MTLRMIMSIGGYAPLPSDAMVTPATFRVRSRKLPGILAEFDAAEDGTRELYGEWVVCKRTWRRLQEEWKASRKSQSSGSSNSSTPSVEQARPTERVVLYIHGGQPLRRCLVTYDSFVNFQERTAALVLQHIV